MTVQQSVRVTPEDTIPTEAELRLELQKMLASKDFDTSSRNRRFLANVVEETLAGRGDRSGHTGQLGPPHAQLD